MAWFASSQVWTVCASHSWAWDGHLARQGIQLGHQAVVLRGERGRESSRHPRATDDRQLLALIVGGVRRDAVFAGEGRHAILGGSDILAARFDDLPVTQRVVHHAAADAIASLEHQHRVTGPRDLPGGGQTGEAGANNHDVHGLRRVRFGGASWQSARGGQRGGSRGCHPDQTAAADTTRMRRRPGCGFRE